MSHSGLADSGPFDERPSWPAACAIAYVYWLVFLLVLAAGNIFDGHHDLGEEVLRMSMAALLGCSIAPWR